MEIKINIHEAKTYLSKYLKHLIKGEKITLCKHNVPIAIITPIENSKTAVNVPAVKKLSSNSTKKRPFGMAKGKITIDDSFNDPLPKEYLEAWYK